ncbi:MAG: hypothetical protein AAF442_04705 [Pseudomonadota bacterium]
MGKKTEEKVRDFSVAYKTTSDLLQQYETQRKRYAPLLVELQYGSKKHANGTPLPDHLKQAITSLDNILKHYLVPLSSQCEVMLGKTEKKLIALSKWVDEKNKADPTNWRKIKDALKVRG